MKTCPYCGQESPDDAVKCRECGTEFAPKKISSTPFLDEERVETIAVLENEAQAGLLDTILEERQIPHIMQTYHDSAYDGLFQFQKGWGAILALPQYRDEIMAALEDIKRQSKS